MQAKSSCDVVTTPVSATSSNGSILERGSHMVKSGLRDDNFFSLIPSCTSLYTVGRPRPLSREVLFCLNYGYQVGSTVAPVSAQRPLEPVKNARMMGCPILYFPEFAAAMRIAAWSWATAASTWAANPSTASLRPPSSAHSNARGGTATWVSWEWGWINF